MDSKRSKFVASLRLDTTSNNEPPVFQKKNSNNSTTGGVSENKGVCTEMLDSINDR